MRLTIDILEVKDIKHCQKSSLRYWRTSGKAAAPSFPGRPTLVRLLPSERHDFDNLKLLEALGQLINERAFFKKVSLLLFAFLFCP